MAPKRRTTEVPTISKWRRIQARPGVEDLNIEVRLSEQGRKDPTGALYRPPQSAMEQLRMMDSQSDARQPGLSPVASDGNDNASDSQASRSSRRREELREHFDFGRHFEFPARTLSAAALKQNCSETSYQEPSFAFVRGPVETETCNNVVISELEARLLPAIIHVLQEQHRDLKATLETNHRSIEMYFNNLNAKIDQMIAEYRSLHQFLIDLQGNGGVEALTRLRPSPTNQIKETSVGGSHPSPAAVPLNVQTVANPNRTPATNLTQQSSPPEVPQYQMQSWIQSVTQLWEEYDRGIPPSPGQPRGLSIRTLEEKYGKQWRRLDNSRKRYQRRKFIWKEVIVASKDLEVAPDQVAQGIDRWMSSRVNKGTSLHKLNDMLAAVAKGERCQLWGPKHGDLLQYI